MYGTWGEEFHQENLMDVTVRNNMIERLYSNVSEKDLKFGSSIITFGNQHDAIFFGKSKNGDIYTFTKNGPYVAPDIIKLDWLKQYAPFGRNPRNPDFNYTGKENGNGFFNPK